MLPKERRLSRKHFLRVRLSRNFCTSNFASIRFLCSSPPGRFSVVVPKSVAVRAVDRNSLRRSVYESLHNSSFPFDGIIYIRCKAPTHDVAVAALKQLLGEARGRCHGSP